MTKPATYQLLPIYTNEHLKVMFNVKNLDSIVAKLNLLGIPFKDEGHGKNRTISVWLSDIESSKPTAKTVIQRYTGKSNSFSQLDEKSA